MGLAGIGNINSTIELYQGESTFASENKYQSYKTLFTQSSKNRLYNETGEGSNKYFIAYKRSHFDYNHGLPYRISNSPDITICFKKDKYFFCLKYTSYSDIAPDYVSQINLDIKNLANVFKILIEKNIQRKAHI